MKTRGQVLIQTELTQMKSLGELAAVKTDLLESVESRSENVTPSQSFRNRSGYKEDFLEDFTVPLPVPAEKIRVDVAPLKDGSGTVLKYEHFSVIMSKSRRLALFTACNIDGQSSRKIKRSADSWSYDGRLDLNYQI